MQHGTGTGPLRTGPLSTGPVPLNTGPLSTGPLSTGTAPLSTGTGPLSTGPLSTGTGPLSTGPLSTCTLCVWGCRWLWMACTCWSTNTDRIWSESTLSVFLERSEWRSWAWPRRAPWLRAPRRRVMWLDRWVHLLPGGSTGTQDKFSAVNVSVIKYLYLYYIIFYVDIYMLIVQDQSKHVSAWSSNHF